MKILGVNEQRCVGCGACAEECCAGLFGTAPTGDGGAGRVAWEDPHGWCTGCGHCLAVCPQGAIRWEEAGPALEPAGVEHPESLCGYEALLPFLQSKRSVRRYRPTAVGREQVAAVLEAMRWAPSGHNLQACRYLAITDRAVMRAITDHTIEGFRTFRRIIRLRRLLRPFLPVNLYRLLDSAGLLEGVNDMIARRECGQDPILFGAPAVIVVYYPDLGSLSLLDPSIAFTYGMLAAHSLGLGSCWIGFAIQSLHKDRAMRKLLGVPADMIVAGVMTLGYPAPVFHRVPPRNEIQVRWLLDRATGAGEAAGVALPRLPYSKTASSACARASRTIGPRTTSPTASPLPRITSTLSPG